MTCTLLDDFYNARLSEAACWSFEYIVGDHLDTCPDCKVYYESHIKNKIINIEDSPLSTKLATHGEE
jgi:predicted anti-sigma-YlaC factor YlaD